MKRTTKNCWVEEIIDGVPKGKRQASLIRLLDRYFRLGLHYSPPWVQEITYGVPEGMRHISAVRLIGRWYAIGLYPKEVKLHLVAWNQFNKPPIQNSELKSILDSTLKWANPHCTPYLSDREVNKIIRQIKKTKQQAREGKKWVK
jgi:hypothetical protein